MTDHRIQRRPPPDLLAPKRERTPPETAYRGEVVPYRPADPPAEYAALAQVAQGSNVAAGLTALARVAESAEALYELGAALEQAGRVDEAIDAWQRAIAKRPSLVLARRRLGAALTRQGEPARAERILLEAAELAPRDSRVRKSLGFAHTALGRPSAALDALREALRLDPDLPENHNNLGAALLESGAAAEAEAAFRAAIRLEPAMAAAHSNLGNALAARGESRGGRGKLATGDRRRPGPGRGALATWPPCSPSGRTGTGPSAICKRRSTMPRPRSGPDAARQPA